MFRRDTFGSKHVVVVVVVPLDAGSSSFALVVVVVVESVTIVPGFPIAKFV